MWDSAKKKTKKKKISSAQCIRSSEHSFSDENFSTSMISCTIYCHNCITWRALAPSDEPNTCACTLFPAHDTKGICCLSSRIFRPRISATTPNLFTPVVGGGGEGGLEGEHLCIDDVNFASH